MNKAIIFAMKKVALIMASLFIAMYAFNSVSTFNSVSIGSYSRSIVIVISFLLFIWSAFVYRMKIVKGI